MSATQQNNVPQIPRTRAPLGFGLSTYRFPPPPRDILLLGPGQYDPKPYDCPYKKGSSWARKTQMEEFSKNLGYRNAHILQERKFWRSQGGPGTYEVSEYVYKKQTSSSLNNVGFGHGERFENFIKHDGPPPNTYYPNIFKHSTLTKRQFTTVPPFEWDGFQDRLKDSNIWKLPPNLYNPKDFGDLAYLLNKRVSKRGPYDLFTGPRDETTIKNYFSPPNFKPPEKFCTLPTDLDHLLHHPAKKRYGKFLKANRFPKRPSIRMMLNDISMCYKDPNHPSPAHYNIEKKPVQVKENAHAFNMSVKAARPRIEWKIQPGVGRYDPVYPKCWFNKTGSWIFRSKATRELYKIIDYTNI